MDTDNKSATTAQVAQIIASYVATNGIKASEVPALITGVHKALAGLGNPTPDTPQAQEPAVSLRRLVKDDAVLCAECGKAFKSIRRHLAAAHDLTPAAYREKWGLRTDHPMVAPAYAAVRSEMARKFGLGRKPELAPPAPKTTRRASSGAAKAGRVAAAGKGAQAAPGPSPAPAALQIEASKEIKSATRRAPRSK